MSCFTHIYHTDIYSILYIIYTYTYTQCNQTRYSSRMIVLDEFDGANHYEPLPTEKQMIQTYGINKIWYYMYFKRSFVSRKDGRFMSYPHKQRSDMYPLTYPLAEAYVQPQFNMVR